MTAVKLRAAAGIVLFVCFAFSVAMAWSSSLWVTAITEAAIFLVCAVAAALAFVKGFAFASNWLIMPFCVLTVWPLVQLSQGRSVYRFGSLESVLLFGSLACTLTISLIVFESLQVWSWFRTGLALFGGMVALLAVLQQLIGPNRIYFLLESPWGPPTGPFVNRDHYSALMELLLPLAVWMGLEQSRRTLLFGVASALMFATVVRAASRAGVAICSIGVAAVLVRGVFLKFRAKPSKSICEVGIICILLFLFSAGAGWGVALARFRAKDMFAYRREFWEASLQMIKDRPWLGFGAGSWQWVYPQYSTFDAGAHVAHAHNDWLEWTSDGGVLLFSAFLAIALFALWTGIRDPWALGPFLVFLHSLVDFPLHNYPILLGLVLIIGAAQSAHIQRYNFSELAETQDKLPLCWTKDRRP